MDSGVILYSHFIIYPVGTPSRYHNFKTHTWLQITTNVLLERETITMKTTDSACLLQVSPSII